MPAIGRSGKASDTPIENKELEQPNTTFRERYELAGGRDIWHGFSCDDFRHQSAPPPTCPESCTVCSDQFVPNSARRISDYYTVEMHGDGKAASVIQHLTETAEANYSYIRNKVNTYGNTIAKFWREKSPKKRQQIMLEAMPDLPLKRHADLELIFAKHQATSDCINGRITTEAFIEQQQQRPEIPFLVPFLNAESLGEKPMRLLALIQYRAYAYLSDWISFDRETINVYFHANLLRTAYNPRCVVVHPGEFGKLVPWSEDAAHRWSIVGYPLARHLFRIQLETSSFLRKVIDHLLSHAGNEPPIGRDVWDRLILTSFQSDNRFVTKSAYFNQVFAPPPEFDLNNILTGLEARVRVAQDNTLLVQADPLHLRRLLCQTVKSAVYPLHTEENKRTMLFVTSVRSMMYGTDWRYLHTLAAKLSEHFVEGRIEFTAGFPLPKEYETDLLELDAALTVRFWEMVTELKSLVCGSRAFRHHFRDRRQITVHETAYRKDPLFWALIELAQQDTDVNRPASWCLSFIDEHLSNASAEERARVDQHLYDRLADMAFVDETLAAINSHISYSPLPRKSDKARQIYTKNYAPSMASLILDLLAECAQDSEVQSALQTFFRLPHGKESSTKQEKFAQNVALLERFDKYWRVVRGNMITYQDKVMPPSLNSMASTLEAKFSLSQKLEMYSSGQPYIFEAEQNALRVAIQKEGMHKSSSAFACQD